MRTRMIAGLMALVAYATLEAQEEHVTFLVMGKTTNIARAKTARCPC